MALCNCTFEEGKPKPIKYRLKV